MRESLLKIADYIETLEQRVAAQEARIEAQESRLAALEKQNALMGQRLEAQAAALINYEDRLEDMAMNEVEVEIEEEVMPEPEEAPVVEPEPELPVVEEEALPFVDEEPEAAPEPAKPEPKPEPQPVKPAPQPAPASQQPQQGSLFGTPVTDLRHAISLGDRFLFQRELFGQNGELMQKTLDALNKQANFDAALAYLNKHFGEWDKESTAYELFINALHRRFG